VTGIELDPQTVRLARDRHPEVAVVEGDLQRATDVVDGPFSLIYSMTAIYAAPDQAAVFRELGTLAAPGAQLRLLEYADPEGRFAHSTAGSATWGWWHPLAPRELPGILAAAGWTSVHCRDLHPEFVHWYRDLCARIHANRAEIVRDFGEDWYDFVAGEYAGILALVREHALGGVLVTARAIL
jgi:SAM-dependent methyltransferase